MNIDLSYALRVIQILATVLSILVSIYLYVRSADRKTVNGLHKAQRDGDAELASRIAALGSEIRASLARDNDFHTRLSIVETKMGHVPTHADLQGIRQEIRDVNESLAAISERSETTHEMVQGIQRFLLDQGARR